MREVASGRGAASEERSAASTTARRADHEPHLPDEAEPVLSPGSERGGAPRRSRREQPGRTTGDGPSRPTEEDWRALAPPNRGSPRSEAQRASPSFGGTQADPRERSDRASAQGRQRKRQRNIHTSHTHTSAPLRGARVCVGARLTDLGREKQWVAAVKCVSLLLTNCPDRQSVNGHFCQPSG